MFVPSFLLTASEPTYGIIMNGTASEMDRNISGLGVVINGTECIPDVSIGVLL